MTRLATFSELNCWKYAQALAAECYRLARGTRLSNVTDLAHSCVGPRHHARATSPRALAAERHATTLDRFALRVGRSSRPRVDFV